MGPVMNDPTQHPIPHPAPAIECGFTDSQSPMTVTIKTGAEIEGMRVAGRLGAEVLDYITPFVKPVSLR